MTTPRFDDLIITGALSIPDTGVSPQTRATGLKQDPNVIFPIKFTDLRVWDAFHTNLPGTAAADDLALVGGTFGTAPPLIQAGDCKALGATTRYARFEVVVPECFDANETFTLNLSVGMKTTVSDTSCTIDLEVYKLDKISGIGSDLCTTSAVTMNSLVFSTKTFVVSSSGLAAGDKLDVRLAIACNDAATATAVIPTVASIDRVCDIKG